MIQPAFAWQSLPGKQQLAPGKEASRSDARKGLSSFESVIEELSAATGKSGSPQQWRPGEENETTSGRDETGLNLLACVFMPADRNSVLPSLGLLKHPPPAPSVSARRETRDSDPVRATPGQDGTSVEHKTAPNRPEAAGAQDPAGESGSVAFEGTITPEKTDTAVTESDATPSMDAAADREPAEAGSHSGMETEVGAGGGGAPEAGTNGSAEPLPGIAPAPGGAWSVEALSSETVAPVSGSASQAAVMTSSAGSVTHSKGNPKAEPVSSSAGPAAPSKLEPPAPHPSAKLSSVDLHLKGEGKESVRVRLTAEAEQLRVEVRSNEPRLKEMLRQDIEQLVSGLAEKSFKADFRMRAQTTDSGNDSPGGSASRHQNQRQGRPDHEAERPSQNRNSAGMAWSAEPEPSAE